MNDRKLKSTCIAVLLLASGLAIAGPAGKHDPSMAAVADITAGNDAWVAGMKQGNADLIAGTFTADAVDCGPDGKCVRGRAAIRKQLHAEFLKYGAAQVATVHSLGSVRDQNFIYEWGTAGSVRGNGQVAAGRYLAIWRRQTDGHWKLYRNLSLPNPAN